MVGVLINTCGIGGSLTHLLKEHMCKKWGLSISTDRNRCRSSRSCAHWSHVLIQNFGGPSTWHRQPGESTTFMATVSPWIMHPVLKLLSKVPLGHWNILSFGELCLCQRSTEGDFSLVTMYSDKTTNAHISLTINLFWVKGLLLKRCSDSPRVAKTSGSSGQICNFRSLSKVQNTHFSCLDSLGVKLEESWSSYKR